MSVYTTVTEAQLRQYLTQFDAGELLSFEGISAGIENTNYFVDTSCGRYVLTLFEQHSMEKLGYFMKLMAWLSEAGVPTAHPLAGKDGQYLRLLCDKPASLVQRLRGKSVEVATPAHCAVMGESLAHFHLAGRGFSQNRANDRDVDWMQGVAERLGGLIDANTKAFIAAELHTQQALMLDALPQGVIHADLFLDNALFDGEQLTGIIDLYYACDGVWLYDVAVAMNDWCRQPNHKLDTARVAAFLTGYARVRSWTAAEKQAWPFIVRRAALRFFLSRLQDQCMPRAGELTQIKDPDVFRQLLVYLQINCPPLAG
jgi:homoserine kinase type II